MKKTWVNPAERLDYKYYILRNDYLIRLEAPADYAEVEYFVRESFWNVYRPGCLEHYVLHCLREDKDFIPELDFVMEKMA